MTALIELHYLPCLEYFCALLPYDRVNLERHDHYTKQSYRNRCYINTSQGPEKLTIPVIRQHVKIKTGEVQIDYKQKWQNQHWRTLVSSYGKSPFFEHYKDGLEEIFFSGEELLFAFNKRLLSFCLESLHFEKLISESVTYEKEPSEPMFDLRSLIHPKTQDSGISFYTPVVYTQVFGKSFVKNLSVIDLLFCQGPHSGEILLSCGTQNLNN